MGSHRGTLLASQGHMAESMTGGRDKIEQTDFSRFKMSYWLKFSFCLRKPNVLTFLRNFSKPWRFPSKRLKMEKVAELHKMQGVGKGASA